MTRFLSKLKPFLYRPPRVAVFAFSILMFLGIMLLDAFTGNEIHVTAFYLFPVCLIAWFTGFGGGLAAGGVASAAWYEAEILGGFHYSHPSIVVWNLFMRTFFYAVSAWLVVLLRRSHEALDESMRELEKRVDERTVQLKDQAVRLRHLAVELTGAEQSERKRIAHILHNRLQQLLVAANIRVALLEKRAPSPDQEDLQATKGFIEKALQESRMATMQLNPPLLHEGGLADGLRFLARRAAEESRINVHLDLTAAGRVKSELLKTILYECVEELLLNVSKHAGVSECFLSLDKSAEGILRLALRDEGRGFDPTKIQLFDGGGFGLNNILERIRALGGTFKIESAANHGAFFEIMIRDKEEALTPARQDYERRKTPREPSLPSGQIP